MATADPLFQLVRLISATDILLSARIECGRRQLLAFVTGSGHLSLHYLQSSERLPVLKVVPWFLETTKRISALTFDPSGTWLLVAGHDGTLYIVPALSLVDPDAALDHRWSTSDVTTFTTNLCSPTSSAPSSLHARRLTPDPTYQNVRISRPTCLAWWQCVSDCQHVAVVGTDRGDILFVSLSSGSQVGLTYVKSHVVSLQICQDNSLDNIFLLITNEQRNQWKLLLEQRATGYIWPLDNIGSKNSELTGSHNSLDMDYSSRNSPTLPTARSRLQGLKQLSVEKLASLKQRLADTRSKGARERDAHGRRGSSGSSGDDSLRARCRKISVSDGTEWSTTGPAPERLAPQVGDTYLQPQYSRGRHLLSGFYAPNGILTIHGMSLEVVPLFVHKLPPLASDVLVTDRFLFVTSTDHQNLSVISCLFSEGRLDGDCDYNPDSVVDKFDFHTEERILALYKRTDSTYKSSSTRKSSNPGRPDRSDGKGRNSKERELEKSTQFALPKDVDNLKVEEKPVDTCVVVTNAGIYEVVLKRPAVEVFMDLILKRQELEEGERLTQIFGLDLQRLLELAGDLMLAGKHFSQAIALYKLSRCRHLKSVLKFAAAGHSKELLSYVTTLFNTAAGELSPSERIHLANLAVMAFTDQLLKAVDDNKKTLLKQFLQFLRSNLNYDEVLAVNVAGQTGLWEVLHFLASHRNLHLEVLDILTKILRSLMDTLRNKEDTSPALDSGLWLCVTTPSLLQSLLARPQLAKIHLGFVSRCLPYLDLFALERLAALFDPSSPVMRPALGRVLASRRRRQYSTLSSDSGQSDSCDNSETSGADKYVASHVAEMLQLFVLVLLYLAKKRSPTPGFDRQLMERMEMGGGDEDELDLPLSLVPLQTSQIGAGFCHTALVRNGSVYTWGNAVQGCLGTGPTMSRYTCPQHISVFTCLRVEVFGVSCGRQHTLALTSNGVYAWGSSQFGQLGVGPVGQSSCPVLVRQLTRERVAAVSAGQYHSLALTSDGRVYSWGWGVHGQLGHHSVEDCLTPRLIEPLVGRPIKQIAAGHGHSLVLTTDGRVLSFGSSIFGQLGRGTNTKSTVPVPVEGITEPVVDIATNYFHNLAVTCSNRLFMWGASPQVLRLQAQAQKKARLMQQHFAQTPTQDPGPVALPTPVETSPSCGDVTGEGPAGDGDRSPGHQVVNPGLSVDLDSPVLDLGINDIVELFNTDDAKVDGEDGVQLQNLHNSRTNSEDPGTQTPKSVRDEDRNVDVDDQNTRNEEIAASEATESFARSVQEYFATDQSTEIETLIRNEDESSLSVVNGMCDSSQKPHDGSEAPLFKNVRTASSEGYVIPTIAISPVINKATTTESPPTVKIPRVASSRQPKKPPTIPLDEGAQTHLSPQLVNTSLVVGQISQIACGCHHSALVTKDGILYTWGRNLDGQLGNGNRREVVVPTPVFSATTSAPVANVIPPVYEKRKVQEVACGCEFTVVVDSQTSRLWAWGSNSNAQLGRAPVDDTKSVEGKLVMIKTMKRVIKLPHGSQNCWDVPREISNVPTASIMYRMSPQDTSSVRGLSLPVATLQCPCYSPETLHYVLQRFHGHLDSALLIDKCVELQDHQAAAKIALLDKNYHLALTHQLKALVLAKKQDDVETTNCKENKIDRTEQCDKKPKTFTEQIIKTDAENGTNVKVLIDDNQKNGHGNKNVDVAIENVESGLEMNESLEKLENGNDRVCKEAVSPDVTSCSSPESTTSSPTASEIHAFAVQGGNEEMSEGRQDLSSPSDTASPMSKEADVLELDREGRGADEERSDRVLDHGNLAGDGTSSGPDCRAPPVRPSELKLNKITVDVGPADTPDDAPSMPPDSVAPRTDSCVESRPVESPSERSLDDSAVAQAAEIVEHYVSEMEDDSHAMMIRLLQQGLDFWLSHSLPVEQLESLLLRHITKFFYPLGLLLFNKSSAQGGGEGPDSMLNRLSTRFCLQLCSTLLSHINQRKPHPEYLELLANVTSMQVDPATGTNGSCSDDQSTSQPAEQLMEVILSRLGGTTTLPYIHVQEQTVTSCLAEHNSAGRLYAFSCGHHYSSAEIHQSVLPEMERSLPNTAGALKTLFEGAADGSRLACPECVLRHVRSLADDPLRTPP